MRKHKILFLCIIFISATINAQTTKSKSAPQKAKPVAKTTTKQKAPATMETAGWSANEKSVFFEACLKQLNWSKDSATQYCNCMLDKIEKLYPSSKDAEKMTQEQAVGFARECLTKDATTATVWGSNERTQFTTQCEAAAVKNIGAEKAKPYCSCMLQKVEKEYPNPAGVAQMKPEMISKWAQECIKQ